MECLDVNAEEIKEPTTGSRDGQSAGEKKRAPDAVRLASGVSVGLALVLAVCASCL